MSLFRQIVEGGLLISLTVAIHTLGAVGVIGFLVKSRRIVRRHATLGNAALYFAGIVGSLVLLHLLEIAVWANFFYFKGLFQDFETAAYYSLMTYTTVGYGDVVLSKEWRLEGTSEALVGILMCGWSTALLIRAVNKFHDKAEERWGSEPQE
jgi:voltage-gated potassium channel